VAIDPDEFFKKQVHLVRELVVSTFPGNKFPLVSETGKPLEIKGFPVSASGGNSGISGDRKLFGV